MSDAIWPAGLPQAPQTASYTQTQPDLTVRTAMDVGPAKVRRRATAGVELCAIELKLKRTQVGLLKSFFLDTLMGGALTFQWKHHETGNLVDYRFTGPPSERPLAPRQANGSEYWVASFTLETMPGTEVLSAPPPPPAPPPPEELATFAYGEGGGDGDGALEFPAVLPSFDGEDAIVPDPDDTPFVFVAEAPGMGDDIDPVFSTPDSSPAGFPPTAPDTVILDSGA